MCEWTLGGEIGRQTSSEQQNAKCSHQGKCPFGDHRNGLRWLYTCSQADIVRTVWSNVPHQMTLSQNSAPGNATLICGSMCLFQFLQTCVFTKFKANASHDLGRNSRSTFYCRLPRYARLRGAPHRLANGSMARPSTEWNRIRLHCQLTTSERGQLATGLSLLYI